MKIHLIKKQTIEDYVKKNVRSKASFEIWFSILKRADWKEPNEIISTFNSADIGTHVEYTKLCNEQKQYDVNSF